MKYRITPRDTYILAELEGRETAADMREFLLAVHAACRERACPRVLMHVRRSRTIFKAEDYGLSTDAGGYVKELVTPACHVALVGDTPELHSAHEYIELIARQQKMSVTAFRDVQPAIRWLESLATAPADPEPTA